MTNFEPQIPADKVGLVVQFIKYAVSGGVATFTHVCLFHAAAWRLFPALEADDWAVRWLRLRVTHHDQSVRSRNSMIDNGIAFLFSNLVAYVLNVCWVFSAGRHSPAVEIALFYAVSGVSIVVGTSIMGWLIRRFGMRTTYAFLSNLVSALLINYAMRKFFIFKG